MNGVFWGFFAVYHAAALLRRRRASDAPPPPGKRGYTVWLQAPLFAAGVYIAHRFGVLGRDLVSPGYVAAGAAVGYGVHACSLLVTNDPRDLRALLRSLAEYFSEWRPRWRYFVESPAIALMLVVNSVVEEIVYRAVAQPLLIAALGRPWLAIGLVAVVFSVSHDHFLRGRLAEGFEFLAYAVLLGVLYHATGSLIFVIVIHTVRNFELYYQQFLIRTEELGSEEAALEIVNREGPLRAAEQS